MSLITNFIPINSNEKAVAFCPSLDPDYRKHTLGIKPKENYIDSLEIITEANKQGWSIVGVREILDKKTRKVCNHFVEMRNHEDAFKVSTNDNVIPRLVISNSTTGNTALNIVGGSYRTSCTNSLVQGTKGVNERFGHTSYGKSQIPMFLEKLYKSINAWNLQNKRLTEIELTKDQINDLTLDAFKLRFGNNNQINPFQLLKSYREGDEGNNIWNVYNRIQENLIKPNLLVDVKGNLISGVSNTDQNLEINSKLYDLVEAYA
jgi:hypothetical protein